MEVGGRSRFVGDWLLRGTFGPKREAIVGTWKDFHIEKLYKMYCTVSQIYYCHKIKNITVALT
jgi:hypothetical protein